MVTGDIPNIIDLLQFMEQKKKSKCPPNRQREATFRYEANDNQGAKVYGVCVWIKPSD